MRRNHPKRRRALRPVERYDTEYISMPERPDVKRIINHPRKTVFINIDAWPLTEKEVEVKYSRRAWKE